MRGCSWRKSAVGETGSPLLQDLSDVREVDEHPPSVAIARFSCSSDLGAKVRGALSPNGELIAFDLRDSK